jgi:hypothetical protein
LSVNLVVNFSFPAIAVNASLAPTKIYSVGFVLVLNAS